MRALCLAFAVGLAAAGRALAADDSFERDAAAAVQSSRAGVQKINYFRGTSNGPVRSAASPYRSVGQLVGHDPHYNDGAETFSCSAFLVAPHVIMTAAHCVRNLLNRELSDDISLGFRPYTNGAAGATVAVVGRPYVARDWDRTPKTDFRGPINNKPSPGDFALLALAPDAPFGPDDVLPLAADSAALKGRSAHSLGFPGGSEDMDRGSDCSIRGTTGTDTLLSDCGIDHGNSGGPLVVQADAGRWLAAGVASSEYIDPRTREAPPPGGDYTDETGNRFCDVSKHSAEIAEEIRRLESLAVRPRSTPL